MVGAPLPAGEGPLQPAGILTGRDARDGIAAGLALPLAGGPSAFTMVRQASCHRPVADFSSERLRAFTAAAPDWGGLGPGPHVMGILNATPDSFSDGGRHLDPSRAIAAGEAMLAAGAALLDVGGESTRPGAAAVSPEEEEARILPIIAALARHGAVVSVDTRNAGTMARALDAGAQIVNDVSALRHDPAAAALVARRRCPVILMHMRGTPATMKSLAVYADVAREVGEELAEARDAAIAAGIAPAAIMLDPGYGFAKTPGQNVELLSRQAALLGLGCPLLAGLSRKSTIGHLAREPASDRLGPGSVAAALRAVERGARIVRVHDVPETVQALAVWRGLNEGA